MYKITRSEFKKTKITVESFLREVRIIRHLQAPTKKRNKKNLELGKPLEEFKIKLRPSIVETQKENTKNMLLLKEKNLEYWQEKIESLPDKLKQRTACVVWWDFYADSGIKKRPEYFNQYLHSEKLIRCTDFALFCALVWCGFTKHNAYVRIYGNKKC